MLWHFTSGLFHIFVLLFTFFLCGAVHLVAVMLDKASSLPPSLTGQTGLNGNISAREWVTTCLNAPLRAQHRSLYVTRGLICDVWDRIKPTIFLYITLINSQIPLLYTVWLTRSACCQISNILPLQIYINHASAVWLLLHSCTWLRTAVHTQMHYRLLEAAML